jgi:hypothetical protein
VVEHGFSRRCDDIAGTLDTLAQLAPQRLADVAEAGNEVLSRCS